MARKIAIFCVMRFVVLLFIALFTTPALSCGGEGACEIGSRSYRALPPPVWDGASPLPVLLHFHGWGRQGRNVVRNKRITEAAAQNGLLLLAPDGIGKSWSFWNPEATRDVDFIDAVLDDAARHWPIDRRRIYVSGFSYGGAMAWRVACARGDAFAGYLPIAGGLWRQSDARCQGPVRLAHVHGLNDTVYGLPIGPEEPIEDGVRLWRRMNGADGRPDTYSHARYSCLDWPPDLTLCTHDGGHFIPKDWLSFMLPRIMAVGAETGPVD